MAVVTAMTAARRAKPSPFTVSTMVRAQEMLYPVTVLPIRAPFIEGRTWSAIAVSDGVVPPGSHAAYASIGAIAAGTGGPPRPRPGGAAGGGRRGAAARAAAPHAQAGGRPRGT